MRVVARVPYKIITAQELEDLMKHNEGIEIVLDSLNECFLLVVKEKVAYMGGF